MSKAYQCDLTKAFVPGDEQTQIAVDLSDTVQVLVGVRTRPDKKAGWEPGAIGPEAAKAIGDAVRAAAAKLGGK